MSNLSTLIITADRSQISCRVWANFSQRRPRHMQAFKLDRYNFLVHDDMYFVGIYQLFAASLAKNAHTGKGELTVAHLHNLNSKY